MTIAQAYQRGWESAIIECLMQISIVAWLVGEDLPQSPQSANQRLDGGKEAGTVGERKPLYQMTTDEIRQARKSSKGLPDGWSDRISIDGGHWDRGAWHRCIDIGRTLFRAGIWDGKRKISIHDPYAVHGLLFGVERLPPEKLVEGQHYSFADKPAASNAGQEWPAALRLKRPERDLQKRNCGKRIELSVDRFPDEFDPMDILGQGTVEEQMARHRREVLAAMEAKYKEARERGEMLWKTRVH